MRMRVGRYRCFNGCGAAPHVTGARMRGQRAGGNQPEAQAQEERAFQHRPCHVVSGRLRQFTTY